MPKYDRNQYLLKDVYKHYKSRVDDPVDYKTHKLILDTWGDVVVRYLMEGRDVQLQERLAKIGIRKNECKAVVDYPESKRQQKRVLRSNSHSGFYAARLYWNSHGTRFNSKGWVFQASRNLKAELFKVMSKIGGHRTFLKVSGKHNTGAKNAIRTKLLKI